MEPEFIQELQTWGSGGHMMDLVVLKDGRILVIAEYGIALYDTWAAFDRGEKRTVIEGDPTESSLPGSGADARRNGAARRMA